MLDEGRKGSYGVELLVGRFAGRLHRILFLFECTSLGWLVNGNVGIYIGTYLPIC